MYNVNRMRYIRGYNSCITEINVQREQDEGEDLEINQSFKEKDHHYLYVAAIDIGTTYSGFAFSSHKDFMKDPLKVYSPIWNSGHNISQKTATFILYDADDNFHSFGYEAENTYLELLEHSEEEALNWRAFYNFKMKLYEHEIDDLEELNLKDDQGKTKPAVTIFADSIRYLKNEMLAEFKKQGLSTLLDEVRFVVTVPAIWDDRSRGFMISAAVEAGIQQDHLMLSLEPEAAAVLCKEHHVAAYHETNCEDILNFDFGSEFVVVDLGGGTVDITTNKVLPCGSLKELKSARGGDCGGTTVDKRFFDFLKSCIGTDDEYEVFKQENLSDFHELRQVLEVKKRRTGKYSSKFVSLTISPAFAQKMDPSKMKEYDNRISISRGKLQLPITFFLSFFEQPIQDVLKCLDEAVTDEIKSILLVGGFANSEILFQAVKERYQHQHVYCPPDSDLSVLKGAVIYGHNTDLVASRICRAWYGIIPDDDFFPKNSESMRHNFYPLTQKGQPVTVDARTIHRFIINERCDKDSLFLSVFSTTSDSIPTSDSKDLKRTITFELGIPPRTNAQKRVIELAVKLNGTEFEFKARVKSRSLAAAVSIKS
ncbi:heat shock 70 kDa protein 12B-like isoform X2 [Ostrea edulis]|uniref:heat shock 70 kDa protein 12B-like isoform X2 n=1 Tax=Ostrea edulis TaxID=37623 RepID=UPI0024AFB35D|nr:heat shock 70 kDa protein 12B-like isoform X2 [Ostrea edulis]